MAELSKQALKVENNTEFPNNNAGLITPSKLRAFNVDMIDSLVDEISYNVASASWNQSIDALEAFTASASGLQTGSLLVTASASGNSITFTKGDASTFSVTVQTGSIPDISALNQATASLQAYTASADVKFTNLESTTASLNTSVTNINTFTASAAISITNLNASSASQQISIDSLNSKTGSYATTGSNTFTGANTFTSISASSFISASQFVGDGSKLTGLTSSISMPILDEGIPQGNAVSLNFTGSAIRAVVVGGTAVISVDAISTSSLNDLTASFQAYTASTDADLAAIHQATASLQSNSASVNTSITNLNASSASQQISIDALNTNSGSVNTSITNINSATASLFTSASLTLVTASINNDDITFTKGDGTQFTIQVATGSFALSASYAETSSITRNVVVVARNGGASTLAAGTVVHITSAVGDNPIFTTASYDNEALSSNTFGLLRYSSAAGADVEVVVSGVVTGVNTDPALGFAAGDVLYLSSSGQFTNVQPQAPNQIVTIGQVLRAQQNNGSIYVSINNGWELNELHNVQITNPLTGDLLQYESSSYGLWKNKSIDGAGIATTASFNAYTSSTNSRLSNIESTTASLNSTTASLLTSASLAVVTASAVGNTITFTKGDTSQFSVSVIAAPIDTASFATTGSNTFNGNQIVNGFVSASGDLYGSGFRLGDTGNFRFLSGSSYYNVQLVPGTGGDLAFSRDGVSNVKTFVLGGAAGNVTSFQNNPVEFQSNVGGVTLSTPLVINSGINSNVQITGSINVSNIGNSNVAGTGSNVFNGTQTISGSTLISGAMVANKVSCFDFDTLFYGSQLGGTTTNGTFFGYGSNSYSFIVGAYSTFDNELKINADSTGITFSDFNGASYPSFLQLLPNSGTNPAPILTRGVEITGSVKLTPASVSTNAQYVIPFISASTISKDSVDTLFYNPSSNILQVSASATGLGSVGASSISITSGSGTATYASTISKNSIVQVSEQGYNIGMSGNPSKIGAPSLASNTKPGIFALSGSNVPYVAIELEASQSFTDGRVTFPRNVAMLQNLEITGSLTASLQQGYVWVGNASGRTTTVATSSFGGGGAGFPFTGDAVITGSLLVSGSTIPDVRVIGNIDLTGSMRVQPVTLSVAANTASIDMNQSNYFILNLPTSSTTHVAFTNIIPGESINLLVSQSATVQTGSIAFAPNIYFPGGNDYVATATGSARDIVSFITFNTNEVYATNVKNLR